MNAKHGADLFGQPLPNPGGGAVHTRPNGTRLQGNVHPASGVRDTPILAGEYYTNTVAFKSTDELRNRAAAARQERVSRLSAKCISEEVRPI